MTKIEQSRIVQLLDVDGHGLVRGADVYRKALCRRKCVCVRLAGLKPHLLEGSAAEGYQGARRVSPSDRGDTVKRHNGRLVESARSDLDELRLRLVGTDRKGRISWGDRDLPDRWRVVPRYGTETHDVGPLGQGNIRRCGVGVPVDRKWHSERGEVLVLC